MYVGVNNRTSPLMLSGRDLNAGRSWRGSYQAVNGVQYLLCPLILKLEFNTWESRRVRVVQKQLRAPSVELKHTALLIPYIGGVMGIKKIVNLRSRETAVLGSSADVSALRLLIEPVL